jgi:hypothetical protein
VTSNLVLLKTSLSEGKLVCAELALPLFFRQGSTSGIEFLKQLVYQPGQSFGIAFGYHQFAEPPPFFIIPVGFLAIVHGLSMARRVPNSGAHRLQRVRVQPT